jgi:DNA-binding FadR family transcriptional regulator
MRRMDAKRGRVSSTRPLDDDWAGTKALEALFRPVRTGNAFEETIERLLHAVRLGIVAPGERLPSERQLADRLGVSRLTLREALRELQRAGYVDSRRGRYGGTFVKATLPSRKQRPRGGSRFRVEINLEDALVLREVVETGAAAEAARREIGVREERYLRDRLEACRSADDLALYRRMDSRLHIAVAELTGSPSLTAATADVRARINSLLDDIPALDQNLRHGDAQHAEIVDAIVARDPERARRAVAEHLEGTAALLRGFLSARRPDQPAEALDPRVARVYPAKEALGRL